MKVIKLGKFGAYLRSRSSKAAGKSGTNCDAVAMTT
jgi:hypothetical protein